MGFLKKLKGAVKVIDNVQKDVISATQKGVEHAANEVIGEADKQIDSFKQDANITIEKIDELKEHLIQEAKHEYEMIVNAAKEEANKIIEIATKEIEARKRLIIQTVFDTLLLQLNHLGKWYHKLAAYFLERYKNSLIDEIDDILEL